MILVPQHAVHGARRVFATSAQAVEKILGLTLLHLEEEEEEKNYFKQVNIVFKKTNHFLFFATQNIEQWQRDRENLEEIVFLLWQIFQGVF